MTLAVFNVWGFFMKMRSLNQQANKSKVNFDITWFTQRGVRCIKTQIFEYQWQLSNYINSFLYFFCYCLYLRSCNQNGDTISYAGINPRVKVSFRSDMIISGRFCIKSKCVTEENVGDQPYPNLQNTCKMHFYVVQKRFHPRHITKEVQALDLQSILLESSWNGMAEKALPKWSL